MRFPQAREGRLLPADPAAGAVVTAVGAGVLCGLMLAVYALAYARLAIPPALSAQLGELMSLALLTAAVLAAIVSLRLAYPAATGVVAPEVALVIGTVAAGYTGTVAPDQLMPTLLATIALASLAVGVVLYALGRARLGRIAQYVPFPVLAGLIGGLGVLLVQSSADLVLPGLWSRPELLQLPQAGLKLGLVAGIGALLLALHLARPSWLHVPAVVVVSLAGFWLLGEAGPARDGWLLGPFPAGAPAMPGLVWGRLGEVDWPAVLTALPVIGSVVALMVVVVLIDASTIEALVGEPQRPDDMLCTVGLANLAAGAVGGFTGVVAISPTVVAHRCGRPCRLIGLTAAAVCLAAWLAGPQSIGKVPAFVIAGLVLFIGLEFIVDWIVRPLLRLGWADRLVILAVVAGVAGIGFAEGLMIGLALGLVLFVVSYSQLSVVRHSTTAGINFSTVDRRETDRQRIREAGPGSLILELEGFLFFGTAVHLFDLVRDRQRAAPPLRHLLLDFARVRGIDASAGRHLERIAELAQRHGFRLVFSALDERTALRLGRRLRHLSAVYFAPDRDRGLEWVENDILASGPASTAAHPDAVALEALGVDPRLAEHLDTVSFAAGEALIHQGELADDVFIIASGTVVIQLDTGGSRPMRLRSALPGAIVGEIAYVLGQPRTASVVAEIPVTAYRLTRARVRALEASSPELVIELQRLILRHVARRLADTTRLLGQLYG
jgi:SulP family sulfate permease